MTLNLKFYSTSASAGWDWFSLPGYFYSAGARLHNTGLIKFLRN